MPEKCEKISLNAQFAIFQMEGICMHQHIVNLLDQQHKSIPNPGLQFLANDGQQEEVDDDYDDDNKLPENVAAFDLVRKLAIEKLSAMVSALHQADVSQENYEMCKTLVHTLNKYPKNEKDRKQTDAAIKVKCFFS